MHRHFLKFAVPMALFCLLIVALPVGAAPAVTSPGQETQSTIPSITGTLLYLPVIEMDRVIHFVDGANGHDDNSGTRDAPWKTVEKAIASIRPGDIVEIAEGIYRVKELRFAPAGTGSMKRTIFRAAHGQRVIFSQSGDIPPKISVADYVRLEGLWFGGVWKAEGSGGFFVGGSPQSYGIELVNNTFFGYKELSQGSAEYLLYQGNRFVHTGYGRFGHSIYLSGGYTVGSMAQHAIVDNNLFIGGEGYAIHGWHKTHNNIVTRNFVSGHYWGLVLDGSDHVVANNFFWRQTGQPGREGPFAAWLPGERILVVNNVFAQNPSILGVGADVTIENNAFLSSTRIGADPREVPVDTAEAAFGVTTAQIDGAIAALESAFAAPVETIFADRTIETHFATLRFTVPQNSLLRDSGTAWYNGNEIANIGPDATGPTTADEFWAAFRSLGFQEFDRFGNNITQGQP